MNDETTSTAVEEAEPAPMTEEEWMAAIVTARAVQQAANAACDETREAARAAELAHRNAIDARDAAASNVWHLVYLR